MRKKWFAFGCLTSIVLLILVSILIGHSLSKIQTKDVVKVKANSYLQLSLSGAIPEFTPIRDDFFDMTQLSAHEIITKIHYAKNDPNIKGIILEPKFMSIGLSTMHEIIIAINDFKQSGKKVYSYIDMASNRDYILCSAADKVYMNPSSSSFILLTGLGANLKFYKEVFDKIGVEYTVVHAGKYKGAGENFTRTSMSEPLKESLTAVFDDVYTEMLSEISKGRDISFSQVKSLYENRDILFINQQYAIDNKLANELIYRKDLLKQLNIKDDHLINVSKYSIPVKKNLPGAKIAVIYANGTISPDTKGLNNTNLSSTKLNKILDKALEDRNIKGIVLRVNSPGGSALESDIMWDKIMQVKDKKPVVISMGDVAASGGYYISAPGDYIYADPFTITGSIGVVGMFPNFNKLGDKIGLHTDGVTRGKFANLMDPWEEINPETLKGFQISINSTYAEFKNRVSTGRGLELDKVEEVAQGRVWSSQDAKENGLIDEIGTIDDAIAKVGSIANIAEYDVEYFPKQKTLFEYVLSSKMNVDVINELVKLPMEEELKLKEIYNRYKSIKQDPVQTLMPVIIE